MTAIATILALIPLAAGFDEELIIAAELGTVGSCWPPRSSRCSSSPSCTGFVDSVRLSGRRPDGAPTEPAIPLATEAGPHRPDPGHHHHGRPRARGTLGPGDARTRAHHPYLLPRKLDGDHPVTPRRPGPAISSTGAARRLRLVRVFQPPAGQLGLSDRGPRRATSPEELIAAAHAACFSMAFSSGLAKNGTPATRLERPRRGHLRQGRLRLEHREERHHRSRRRSRASTRRASPRLAEDARATARSLRRSRATSALSVAPTLVYARVHRRPARAAIEGCPPFDPAPGGAWPGAPGGDPPRYPIVRMRRGFAPSSARSPPGRRRARAAAAGSSWTGTCTRSPRSGAAGCCGTRRG